MLTYCRLSRWASTQWRRALWIYTLINHNVTATDRWSGWRHPGCPAGGSPGWDGAMEGNCKSVWRSWVAHDPGLIQGWSGACMPCVCHSLGLGALHCHLTCRDSRNFKGQNSSQTVLLTSSSAYPVPPSSEKLFVIGSSSIKLCPLQSSPLLISYQTFTEIAFNSTLTLSAFRMHRNFGVMAFCPEDSRTLRLNWDCCSHWICFKLHFCK